MSFVAELAEFRRSHPYRELDVAGVRWQYRRSGTGPDVLLMPSGGLRRPDTYLKLIERLEQTLMVIGVAYPPVPSMAQIADGLCAVLDNEGVQRAHVFGSSFGGYVTQVLMQRHPERVGRVVLANTSTQIPGSLRGLPLIIKLMKPLPERAVRAISGVNIRRMLGASSGPDTQLGTIGRDLLANSSKADLIAALQDMADFARHHAKPFPWSGDVLIIESEHDEAFSPRARAALRAAFPAARVAQLAEGHAALGTAPDAYAEAIRAFVQGGEAPRQR